MTEVTSLQKCTTRHDFFRNRRMSTSTTMTIRTSGRYIRSGSSMTHQRQWPEESRNTQSWRHAFREAAVCRKTRTTCSMSSTFTLRPTRGATRESTECLPPFFPTYRWKRKTHSVRRVRHPDDKRDQWEVKKHVQSRRWNRKKSPQTRH